MIIKYCPKEEGAVFDGWDEVIDNECPNCHTQLTTLSVMTHTIQVDSTTRI